ncbi:protein kinase family protein [Rugosimonospora africana]|uniref:Protein kinase domain-containing protein n=1 Tax=Rugosimonospora africana TaxID=556532 RepID=A0A8J3QNE4_9ACTN|nr:protein kinase family protein [Rugosimonospora africana]GIH13204.1 hypothetical protein Raf01_13760 [Rugosimonospora africana]
MTQVDEGPDSPGVPGILTFGVPTVGEVLAERYELQEHINDDAFGRQVWRGIDVILRRPVAVVLRYPGGEAAVEMLDAAVAASRVVHPHLVDVYDAIDEGNRAYVVREWVDGSSLRELVMESPLDPDRATSVASAVAGAVAAVHATGMAHGNVHPGTVLIGDDGRVVLADARADESATIDGDVRAIGGVLYCALTGHWPKQEAGSNSLPDAVRDPSGVLAAPRQVRGGVPGHLSDLATDVLDPELAPPSADVLAAELGRLDSEQRDSEFFGDGGPLDFNQTRLAEPVTPEARRSVGRKLAVGVAGLVVLALIGLLIVTKVFSGPSGGGQAQLQPPSNGHTSGAPTPAAGQPTQVSLGADQVRIVDPQGDGQERRDADKMVDGNSDTAWETQHYKHGPNFGNTKSGMGVWIDLGAAKKVSLVKIDFTIPGATVQLKAGNTAYPSTSAGDAQTVANYTPIGSVRADAPATTTLLDGNGQSVRYLLVWITSLPQSTDQSDRWQVGIDEIQVLAS